VTRVALFEPADRLRNHLVLFLRTSPGVEAVEEASHLTAFADLCSSGDWDVAVISVRVANPALTDLITALRAACPTMPLVIITLVLDAVLIRQRLEQGVAGIVAAEDIVDELPGAIRTVRTDRTYLSPKVQTALR
jgi:two-component system, NarL family, captular synthesis response regulator RcsB